MKIELPISANICKVFKHKNMHKCIHICSALIEDLVQFQYRTTLLSGSGTGYPVLEPVAPFKNWTSMLGFREGLESGVNGLHSQRPQTSFPAAVWPLTHQFSWRKGRMWDERMSREEDKLRRIGRCVCLVREGPYYSKHKQSTETKPWLAFFRTGMEVVERRFWGPADPVRDRDLGGPVSPSILKDRASGALLAPRSLGTGFKSCRF